MKNFVIICMGRTGSAWLVGLLNSHPEIHCEGELFHTAFVPSHARPSVRREILDRARRAGGLPIFGFKFPYDSLIEQPGLIDDLREDRFKAIHLHRQNALDHLISVKLAISNNNWLSQSSYEDEALNISRDELLRFIGAREATGAMMSRVTAGIPSYHVSYETLSNPQVHKELTTFLEAPPAELRPATVRSRRRPACDIVANYAELVEILSVRNWRHAEKSRRAASIDPRPPRGPPSRLTSRYSGALGQGLKRFFLGTESRAGGSRSHACGPET